MPRTQNANGKPKPSTTVICLRNIPRGLRDIYKATVALEGISMRRDLINYMRKKCRESKRS